MNKKSIICVSLFLSVFMFLSSPLYAFWGKGNEKKLLEENKEPNSTNKIEIESYKNKEIDSLINDFYSGLQPKSSENTATKDSLENNSDKAKLDKVTTLEEKNTESIFSEKEIKNSKLPESISSNSNHAPIKIEKQTYTNKSIRKKDKPVKKKRVKRIKKEKKIKKTNKIYSTKYEPISKNKKALNNKKTVKIKYCKSCKKEFDINTPRIFCPYDGEKLIVKEKLK